MKRSQTIKDYKVGDYVIYRQISHNYTFYSLATIVDTKPRVLATDVYATRNGVPDPVNLCNIWPIADYFYDSDIKIVRIPKHVIESRYPEYII